MEGWVSVIAGKSYHRTRGIAARAAWTPREEPFAYLRNYANKWHDRASPPPREIMFEDRYSFGARVAGAFPDVREGVVDALRAEGFGVLTEIDVAATMKARLDVDLAPYVILGACNPPLAHRALTTDPSIGVLLPCNVVVRADGETVVVEAMDPAAVLGLVGDPRVDEVAGDVRSRLARTVDAIALQFAVTESVS